MKLVRESLLEKFIEVGDPVRNMGIGAKQDVINAARKMLKINGDESGEIVIHKIVLTDGRMWIMVNTTVYAFHVNEYIADLIIKTGMYHYVKVPPQIKGNQNYDFFIYKFKKEIAEFFRDPIEMNK